MRSRTSVAIAMVLIGIVAFSLGSVGTATAAGLTKAAVKRIASKVVHQESSKLTVGHAAVSDSASSASHAQSADRATTADTATNSTNADNLGGQPATSYLKNISVVSREVDIAGAGGGADSYANVDVTCPNGLVLSGNLDQLDGYPSVVIYRSSITNGGRTFSANLYNQSPWPGRTAFVYVICAG